MNTYKVNSRHAESLADGSMVAPGSLVEVDENEEFNRKLIERGVLVHATDQTVQDNQTGEEE